MQEPENNRKNLKDSTETFGLVIKDIPIAISYKKTNKLVTALYMVTDIIDADEPLRNKLRTLGTDVISDIHEMPARACIKISQILAFLDIARTMNIISAMNCDILRKEFGELNQSIRDSRETNDNSGDLEVNLSDFFKEELPELRSASSHGRIGVQKGSTLMKALSDRTNTMSDRNNSYRTSQKPAVDFDMLKKERRYQIVNLIKAGGGSATISDIKNKAEGALASCGEKTLQRELVSMVKDGVLKKTGEKRWSRYFLNRP